MCVYYVCFSLLVIRNVLNDVIIMIGLFDWCEQAYSCLGFFAGLLIPKFRICIILLLLGLKLLLLLLLLVMSTVKMILVIINITTSTLHLKK